MCYSTRKIPGRDYKYMLNMTHAWLLIIILLPWLSPVTAGENGPLLYTVHCATCHQKDAMGIEDALPPLAMSDIVMGELSGLVDLIVKGKIGTAMRPYGVMLNEDQLVAIIEYLQVTYSDKQDKREKILPLVIVAKKQAEHDKAESDKKYQHCLNELNRISDPGELFAKTHSCEENNLQLTIYGYNLLLKKYPKSDLVPKVIERLDIINPAVEKQQ